MNFEDELQHATVRAPLNQEREISLGTGTILAIFFALTLICAAFFGFGYSIGRRSEKAAAANLPAAGTAAKADSSDSVFSNFKAAPTADASTGTKEPPPAGAPNDTSPPPETARSAPSAETAASPVGTVVQPAADPDGAWMVQVSATTRKPDAEALSRVLVRQGFTTMIRPDADGKYHVRVGPFADKKDADTTRKLLIASGYKDPFLTPK